MEIRTVTGEAQHESPKRQEFASGRELIETVKARREEAQAFKALTQDVETELSATDDALNPDLRGSRCAGLNRGALPAMRRRFDMPSRWRTDCARMGSA